MPEQIRNASDWVPATRTLLVGGSMVEVQENMAMLEASDREALAAYLKAIPPQPAQ